jgi:hypothetical protein
MSMTRGYYRRLTLLCAAALVFCLQTAAFAAKVPPTIDEIEGTYAVKDKGAWYDFLDGSINKYKGTSVWEITKTSSTTVEVYIAAWGPWTFDAYYANGILVLSHGLSANEPSTEMDVGIILFSGSAGKVKFKGNMGYDALYDNWCEYYTVAGKMTEAANPPAAPAAEAHRANAGDDDAEDPDGSDILEAGEILKGAAPPPDIDDLVGTYQLKLAGRLYQPSTGLLAKGKEVGTLVITKDDGFTLNLYSVEEDDNLKAAYANGILMVGDVDDDSDVCGDSAFAVLLVKGKPGKIKMKGMILGVMDLYDVDDEVEVAKASAKQVAP